MSRPVRLNLGPGDGGKLKGYRNLDRKDGHEAYPLAVKDGSVDEIRASHLLEHFPHHQAKLVLEDWYRALKPGGLLKVAVPDFEWMARSYLEGADFPVQSTVMGGQQDADDFHHCIFDEEALREEMRRVGLYGIAHWPSDAPDCSGYECSLNLQGFKPPATWPRISGVMSVPRLGFLDNMFCAFEGLRSTRVRLRKHTGAYWEQCITRGIEQALESEDPEYILTIDYDSIYSRTDVEALVFAMMRHPEVDALAPIQASRSRQMPLMTVKGEDGQNRGVLPRSFFKPEVAEVRTAHFGLTLIRVSALLDTPLPWFHSKPDSDGRWDANRSDADIEFWRNWERAGKRVYIANRVSIGHAELMVRWPGRDLAAIHQHPTEYWETGKPSEAWR